MFTHVQFFRPSTNSNIFIEAPFEFGEDAHMDERFISWTIEEYSDWIPKAYLVKENYGSDD
jgi:hypothetical protein